MVLNFFYLPNEAVKSLLNWHVAPMIATKIKLVRLPKYIPISTHFILIKNGSVLYFDRVFFVIFKP